jgi:hypothetical protein
MQAIVDPGGDAKILACPAHGPEELRVSFRAAFDEVAFRGDHLERCDVVTGKAKLTDSPPVSSTEGESCDSGGRGDAEGCHEALFLGFPIELAEIEPGLGVCTAPGHVHGDFPSSRRDRS